MVNLAEWDSLANEMKRVGKAGRLPKNAPIQKVVDELQRSVDTMREVVHQLLRHNRIGPDWNAVAAPPSQARYVSLRWDGVGNVTIDGVLYQNGLMVNHNAGFILSNFVEVRRTFATSTPNPLMNHWWRIAKETERYTLLQVAPNFVNNRAVVDLILFRGLEVSAARESSSGSGFAGFQQQGPVEPEQDFGEVTGSALQEPTPGPPDPVQDINLGSTMRNSGSFTMTAENLTAGQPMFVYEIPGDDFPDETESDRITCAARATSATVIQVYWISHPGPVSGTHKFAYARLE